MCAEHDDDAVCFYRWSAGQRRPASSVPRWGVGAPVAVHPHPILSRRVASWHEQRVPGTSFWPGRRLRLSMTRQPPSRLPRSIARGSVGLTVLTPPTTSHTPNPNTPTGHATMPRLLPFVAAAAAAVLALSGAVRGQDTAVRGSIGLG